MEKLEILAPSGDWDSFSTAINNGADAVYLGLGEFNARAKSTYFTTQNIRETVEYAHLFGVKVYVTINTLVKDEEMQNFLNLVRVCVDAKVDAFIVQDYGCAYILKQNFKNIVLHASTQMGIHNVAGAKIAKKMGFSRVVLSREVKLQDIIAIKEQTGLEIEYFVQGALCVAFSGNCYFSALNHNQSGNRGKCLQLCRLPYSAYIDDKPVGNGYLLSARDLCLLPNLKELIDAGVQSFKIEGRLRRAGYVGQAVNTYRKAVDAILNKTSINEKTESHKLQKVFSRGEFNNRAYLDNGVPDSVINPINQNHLGVKIGQVLSVQKFKDLNKVEIKSTHKIKATDGLKFLNNLGEEVDSLGVGNVEISSQGNYIIYTKHRLAPNLDVYLTLDSELENNVIANRKKIKVALSFNAQVDCPIIIEAKANNSVTYYTSDYICQSAKTAPTSYHEIEEIFKNLNLDIFEVKTQLDLGNVFIPKSALKDARRIVAENLKNTIINDYEKLLPIVQTTKEINSTPITNDKLFAKYNNIYIVDETTDLTKYEIENSDLICLQPTIYTAENVLKNISKIEESYQNYGLVLPTIANEQDIIILDEIVKLLPNIPLIINNAYGLKYANTNYLIAGLDMNIYNSFTIKHLQDLGVQQFIFSKEIETSNSQVYQFSFGHQTLMYFAHCPFKTLFKNTCKSCKYNSNLTLYDDAKNKYLITRTKLSQCYFTLYSNKVTNKNAPHKLIDLRSLD